MRTFNLSVALALIFLICLGCPSEQGTVYIGICEPESVGPSLEIALEEIEAAGGLGGWTLECVYPREEGAANSINLAIRVADELASDDRLSAVIAHNGSIYSIATAHLYNRKGIVNIVPAASSPLLSNIGRWTFRMSANDDIQGRFLAEVAVEHLGFSRVAVVYENIDYGRLLSQSFIESFNEKGGETAFTAWFDRADNVAVEMFAQQIQRKAINQLLYVGSTTEFITILEAFRDAGIEATFLTGDSSISLGTLGMIRGAAGQNRVFASFFSNIISESPRAVEFRRKFYEKHGRIPNAVDEIFYDSIRLLAEAIEAVGPDRSSLREYIASLGSDNPPFEGVVGEIAFDARGESAWPITLLELGDELSLVATRTVPKNEGEQR